MHLIWISFYPDNHRQQVALIAILLRSCYLMFRYALRFNCWTFFLSIYFFILHIAQMHNKMGVTQLNITMSLSVTGSSVKTDLKLWMSSLHIGFCFLRNPFLDKLKLSVSRLTTCSSWLHTYKQFAGLVAAISDYF